MKSDFARELARPFPKKYVKQVQGEDYVPHHIVTQRLIHIFGVAPKTEILRELYDGDKLTGVVMRMTVSPGAGMSEVPLYYVGPDIVVEEAGEADNPQAKSNGARAKSAASDAYKRCAMRLSLGLHLWAREDYFLFDALTKETTDEQATPQASGNTPPRPAPPSRETTDHPVRPVSKEEVVPSADESGEELSEEGRSSPVLVAKRMQVKILMQDKTPDNIDSLSEKELEALIGKHSKGGKK